MTKKSGTAVDPMPLRPNVKNHHSGEKSAVAGQVWIYATKQAQIKLRLASLWLVSCEIEICTAVSRVWRRPLHEKARLPDMP